MNINSHPWFDPEALVGTSVDGYQLDSLAGSGGFGAVYVTKGRDGVALALKVLYPPYSNTPEDLEDWTPLSGRFLLEAQTASRFQQANIIPVHNTGQFLWHFDDPRGRYSGNYLLPYYVADYFPDGLDLRGGGSFGPEAAVRIAQGICDGLAALHSAEPKVLHLDLNPGNIRIADDGRPVITDFGVAHRAFPRPPGLTVPSPIFPGVAAPEQFAAEEPDERTDIYQLGSLLCWMLVGHYPNAGGIPELLARSDIDRNLIQTILRCVEASRRRRFQDVASLKAALAVKSSTRDRIRRIVKNLIPPWWRRPAFATGFLTVALAAAWVLGLLPPYGPVEIDIISSSTKQEWLADMVKSFNENSEKEWALQYRRNSLQLFGRRIEVTVIPEEIEPGEFNLGWRSGAMVEALRTGRVKPTIASPADAIWVEKIDQNWLVSLQRRISGGGLSIMKSEAEDLLRTPLVLAMWKSRAEAMGCWPDSGPLCTWQAIVELTSDPYGWASFGKPTWDDPTVGFAIVGRSNSATFMAMFICLSGLEAPHDPKLDDISAGNGCGQAISDFHKGDLITGVSNTKILEAMRELGPGYIDVAVTYETEIVEINEIWGPTLEEPLVSVYPQDGTTISTHPFAILDGAPWVSEKQAAAARVFKQFLLSPAQQQSLVQHGLRPIIKDATVGPPIDRDHGANADADFISPEITLEMLDRVVAVWEELWSQRVVN